MSNFMFHDQTEYFDFVGDMPVGITSTLQGQVVGDGLPERGKYLVLRHDVDHNINHALTLARAEHDHGIASTYFFLHTAPYFDDPDFPDKVAEIYYLGHEVGLHHNALAEHLRGNGAIPDIINKALSRLRSAGVEVIGAASHGDRLCRDMGIVNHDIWAWRPPGFTSRYKFDAVKWEISDFGLEYEAYFSPCEVYLSDTGGKWHATVDKKNKLAALHTGRLIGPEAKDVALQAFTEMESGVMQMLIHPVWWTEIS